MNSKADAFFNKHRTCSPGPRPEVSACRFYLKSRTALFLCCLLSFLYSVYPSFASAQQTFSGPIGMDKKELAQAMQSPWTIEAEKLSHDQESQLYEAEVNVRISSGDKVIVADYASVDMVKRRADLRGNVTVQYGRNWLKGEHVTWNLDSETGWLDDGIVFFADNNFFVQGKAISKTGTNQFELSEGFLTSCNPSAPEWKIQYDKMKVDVGGVAWSKNTSFWAGKVPIAFSPFLAFPIEQKRQSGFLLPWAAVSDLNGVDFELPFYWAIREDMDATLYARYMEKRGFMAGAEYRVNNPQFGRGVWMFNYLDDQADRSFLADKGYAFQAEDRYWLRNRHDFDLPWDVKAKVDLDFVSDRNFLQEFSSGSTSTAHAEKVFQDYFGRGLLYDRTSPVRESSVYLEKRGESSLLSMDLRYWQQLNGQLEPTTTQKLPSFSFTMLPQGIGESPFYYTLESTAVNYWRRQGDTEQRLDIHPRVYYPLHWANYLDVEPSVGFRTSTYAVEWDNKNFDTFNQRAVTDARVEMSSRLNKVYPVDFGNYTAIQHAIRPEVAYEYATQAVHGNIPHLDRLDEDQARNGIRYGFSTFLMAKESKTDAGGNPVSSYREWARFRVFQFFNAEKPVIEDPAFSTQVMDEGFSPVGIRLDIIPRKYLTLSYDADFDWNGTGEGNAHDFYMTLDSGKGHILRLDYQRQKDLAVNEITAEVLLKTFSNLYLNTYHDYSLRQDLMFKQGYGFRYFRGCWGIGVAFEREGSDNRVIVSVDLLGLGTIGRSNLSTRNQFSESYPGYQRPESWMLSR
ncbi:MAG: LPS-assembly protein LptD [Syntrophobacteraceae bacterium]